MPRSSTLVVLAAVLVCGGSLRAQQRDCWQRDCPDDTTFVEDSLPGVANSDGNFVALTAWARNHGMPSFEGYSVSIGWTGQAVTPDVHSNPEARRYRTSVRETVAEGPNFADHFALVWWGCGSPCVRFLIVDLSTGRTYSNGEQLVTRPMFRRDSRLIVEDPTGFMTDSIGHPGFPRVRYWEWTGRNLRLIASMDTDTLPVRVQF